MSNERLFANQFEETANKGKANSLLHAVSNFESIISHVTTMKCLSILKAFSIRQKQDITIISFKHTNTLTVLRACYKLRHQRRHWYSMSSSAGGKARIEPSLLYVFGRQQHRNNAKAGTPANFHKRKLTIPLMDHLISEMLTYFDPNNDAVMSSLLYVLPALLIS